MASYFFVFIIISLTLSEFVVTKYVCPTLCECNLLKENGLVIFCDGATTVHSSDNASILTNKQISGCNTNLEINGSYLSASHLYIDCFDVIIARNMSQESNNLTQISVINSKLSYFPLNLLKTSKNLRFLNLSGNWINEIHIPHLNLNYLEVLDLSHNKISEAYFENGSLPRLKKLYIQENDISELGGVANLYSLKFLDISLNSIKSISPTFHLLPNVQSLILQSVPSIVKNKDICSSMSVCKTLPQSISLLDLANNSLFQVPSCDGILAGLRGLKRVYLDDNEITVIDKKTFQAYCFSNLNLISLANNRLIKMEPHSFMNMHNLQTLILNNNYLQHIPLATVQMFHRRLTGLEKLVHTHTNRTGLQLDSNRWSCDCSQKDLRNWLIKQKSLLSILCHIPKRLHGQQLKNTSESELECTTTVIPAVVNVSAFEYESSKLGCEAIGIPKPVVVWFTPKGEEISVESISKSASQQKLYELSPFGQLLTVQNVRLDKTGIYRCLADNSFGSANKTIALRVTLSNVSTIIYLVVACVAFLVGIVFNSINMCMYMYEHFETKRLYRKALQEQKNEVPENPPLKSRSKTLDESIASLNAYRHYGKYDFTCQQMFLDTVIKGAHSVKKTLYDARHSEFSVNVWEYAANLRDRLHIEMPSSMQLPSLNMPSISMPTISMPTIPTIQDINTNIEKLGTSVMTRSHNLATSVGSVFTLKRWMWQQSNSSDNESRDSDEHLENGISRVEVDVHVHESPEEASTSTFSRFNSLFTNRSDFDGAGESRSSKSLPSHCRPQEVRSFAKENSESVKISEKSVRFDRGESSFGDVTVLQPPLTRPSIAVDGSTLNTISEVVANSCHSYETSV